MSTETGPDLTAGREAVERLMDDTVVFSAASNADDWDIDPQTLRLVPPSASVLYDGACKVKPLGGADAAQSTDQGQILGLDAYRVDVPLGSPVLPVGTVGVLTSSRRMPSSVGEVYVVRRNVTKTLAVQASYAVERRTSITP